MSVLEMVSVTKNYRRTAAVSNLSLRVEAGEVVGLIGANGAGKTTTLRMAAGLIAPSAGKVYLNGIDVQKQPHQARRSLGFLTASTGVYERLTPLEMLQLFGQLNGMENPLLKMRISEVAEELGLTDFLHRRCGVLSTGQRQRVSIARSVIHDPLLYLLDEPTSTLDPLSARAIVEMIRRNVQRGKSVVLSTHRMEEAQLLCHRLYILAGGKVVAEGVPAEVQAASKTQSLTEAFLHYARV